MNIRWLWLDHFPPGMDLTPQQRIEAKKLALEHRKKDPKYRGAASLTRRLMFALIAPLGILFTLWVCWPFLFGRPFGTTATAISGALSPVVFNALVWLVITYTMYRTSAPFVRRALCDLGRPVCIDCGYILTGLEPQTARCPECGAERETPPSVAPSRGQSS